MKITTLYTTLLFCILHFAQATAQNYPPPTGVYCSCGPTLGTGYGSVDPAIATKPFVKGILVRVPWRLIETEDDVYSWKLIDDQIAAANSFGKKISLGIGNGGGIPQWLYAKGAKQIVATSPRVDTIAVPWDSIYLAQWTQFVAELGNRYNADTTIQLVYITNSTANGFEMQMPFQSIPTLANAGYSDENMTSSWKWCIDAFNAAFPNHYLSNDFHPVNGSNAVADSVYAYAQKAISSRYGANAWWWTQKNAQTVYPAQYAISLHSAKNNKFTGVQFANSGTTDSAKFGSGGMQGALQLAIDDGICYWEIWNQDILNPAFEQLLTDADCKSVSTAIDNAKTSAISLYPNPAQNVVYIEGNVPHYSITVYTPTGQKVLSHRATNLFTTINIEGLAAGLYIAQIETANTTTLIKLLIEK